MQAELAIEARPPVELDLVIPGEPDVKGRPKFDTRTGRTYTDHQTQAAQDAISWRFRQAWGRGAVSRNGFVLSCEFHCGTTGRKDLDNMLKLVMDAGNKIVWRDDGQVCEVHARVFRGVPRPRTEITIREVLP